MPKPQIKRSGDTAQIAYKVAGKAAILEIQNLKSDHAPDYTTLVAVRGRLDAAVRDGDFRTRWVLKQLPCDFAGSTEVVVRIEKSRSTDLDAAVRQAAVTLHQALL